MGRFWRLSIFLMLSSGLLFAEDARPVTLQGALPPKAYSRVSPMNYSLLTFPQPRKNEKFPLLLALHGTGQNAENYLSIWENASAKYRLMVVAPRIVKAYSNRPEEMTVFFDLTEEIVRHYPVDPKRIFVVGASSGALLARWLVRERPLFWRGAALVASPSFEAWPPDPTMPPLLFVHGKKDPMFPVGEILRTVEGFKAAGFRVEDRVYPEGIHEHKAEWNDEIVKWFLEL